MARDVVESDDPIEGDWEVVIPPPKVEWSFWKDDLPFLAEVALYWLIAPPFIWLVHRLLS